MATIAAGHPKDLHKTQHVERGGKEMAKNRKEHDMMGCHSDIPLGKRRAVL